MCVQVRLQVYMCNLATYMCHACIVSYNCMYQVLNMCICTFKFMLCDMGTPSLVMLMVRCCTGVEGFQVKISCQNSCPIEEGFCRDSHKYYILLYSRLHVAIH